MISIKSTFSICKNYSPEEQTRFSLILRVVGFTVGIILISAAIGVFYKLYKLSEDQKTQFMAGYIMIAAGSLILLSSLFFKCVAIQPLSNQLDRKAKPQQAQEASPPQQNKSNDELISEFFTLYMKSKDITASLQTLEKSGFFKEKSQEKAKYFFELVMKELCGTRVFFPKSVEVNLALLQGKKLDLSKFCLARKADVDRDIKLSAQDSKRIHVYQVASQYNAAEATHPFTPPIGQAMIKSKNDNTQGPLAQRTNPLAFELVTAFLTHLGFNMLEKALPMAGTTYKPGDRAQHGYLLPDNVNLEAFIKQLQESYAEAEYVCYESKLPDWQNSVYIYLQAAPAIAYARARGLSANTDELEKYAALSNYTAFFQSGIDLAKENPDKPVVLHLTAVGGGVFGNKEQNLQWAFEQAVLHFQDEMPNNLLFQLESREDTSVNAKIAKNLGIVDIV